MSEGKVEQSTPEQFNAYYKTLHEAPSDVLASRIVGSLILQKGNLVKYEGVIQHFIERYRAEEAAHAPSPSETGWKRIKAEAYERGVRDAAGIIEEGETCDCGAPKTKYNTECGHAMNCPRFCVEEILALLQSNPYRGKEPTK